MWANWDAFVSIPDEGDMTFLHKKGKSGAAVGKLVLLQVFVQSRQNVGVFHLVDFSFDLLLTVSLLKMQIRSSLGLYLLPGPKYSTNDSTDKAKIPRKRLKSGKLEHGNGRARKKPGGSYQNQTLVKPFQQRFDESFYEAWDRFNDLLRACPHHGFSELHQLDTFYNALNANDQDSLNSAAGGNFLDKMPRECLRIIESKSKVRNSRNKAVVAKVSSNSSTPGISPDVAALTTEVSELKNLMKTMLIDKQKAQAPATVKAVEQSCVTCGGAHSYKNCPATDGNVYQDNIQEYVSQAAAANFNQGNTNSRPLMVANQI
ncbi:hypothetical protein Tco_0532541 [Tanacetum coccineum]